MSTTKIMEERKTFTSETAFLAFSNPEGESLDAQIDRLSKYIETMVRPEPPRRTVTAEDSMYVTTLRSSSIEWDDHLSFMIEDYSVVLERMSMNREDFRSFELRRAEQANIQEVSRALQEAIGVSLPHSNIEELAEAVKGLMGGELQCSLYDLYAIQSQLNRIISFAEDNLCHEGQLKIGPHTYQVKVNNKHSNYFKDKQWLIDLLRGRPHKKDKEYN